jgi:hypothetical protein
MEIPIEPPGITLPSSGVMAVILGAKFTQKIARYDQKVTQNL